MPIPEDTGLIPKIPQSGRTDIDAATFDGLELRALVELFNKRDNYLTNRIAELQSAMDAMKASTGAVDNLRAAIPANFLATNTRVRADAIQDYKDLIIAGDADP